MKNQRPEEAPAWGMLRDLAAHASEDSARRLAATLRSAQDAQQQLSTLVGYRDDYQARLSGAQRDGIGCEGMRNYRAFLDNLEQAIAQQSNVLANLNRRLAAARADWDKDRQRVESYQTLDDRHQCSVRRLNDRREQRLQDEMATRAYLRRRAGAD